MKVLKNILIVLLLCSGLASTLTMAKPPRYSTEEYVGRIMEVTRVDTKKRIIEVDSTPFAYNSLTKVVNSKGESIGIDALQPGMDVTIQFNGSQRFISMPTLSVIKVKN